MFSLGVCRVTGLVALVAEALPKRLEEGLGARSSAAKFKPHDQVGFMSKTGSRVNYHRYIGFVSNQLSPSYAEKEAAGSDYGVTLTLHHYTITLHLLEVTARFRLLLACLGCT